MGALQVASEGYPCLPRPGAFPPTCSGSVWWKEQCTRSRTFGGSPRRSSLERMQGQSVLVVPLDRSHPPTSSPPHPLHSHLTGLSIPCTPHREQAGRNPGLSALHPPLSPRPASTSWGRVGSNDLSTSPILLPLAFLPFPPGLAGAKENRASPALPPPTSCSGKMVYSLPRPGWEPGLGVKFLQSFQNQRPCLGSGWTPHLSPFHLLRVLQMIAKTRGRKDFLGVGGMWDESGVGGGQLLGEGSSVEWMRESCGHRGQVHLGLLTWGKEVPLAAQNE